MTFQPHPQQQAIRAIHDTHGALTPALLLECAGQGGFNLHHLFDWNTTEPELLERAKRLIRAQRVVVTDRSGSHVVPEYVSVMGRDQGVQYKAFAPLRQAAEETT